MKKLRLVIIVLISLFINSCEDVLDTELFLDTKIQLVEYGTSFGECMHYCKNTIVITPSTITFTSSSNVVNSNYPDIIINAEFSSENWDNLLNEINFLTFRNLEEVIGCPDCVDQGAEWVKIVTEDLSHKVTYEYGDEPEELEDLVEVLKTYFNQYLD